MDVLGRRARLTAALAALVVVAGCPGPAENAATPTPTSTTSSPTMSVPPAPAEPTYVAVKGDWGAGGLEQHAITRRMCAVRRIRPFSVVVTTGDNFYGPDGVATERTYDDPERCLIRNDAHRWRASWGNHDVAGRDTRRVLGAPRYERWRTGGALFVALDSNQVFDGAQQRFLERTLSRATGPIKIVYFHHPPFTAGSVHQPSGPVQDRWVPLFERHQVTLVLNGHSHLYEHHAARSVHYVVTGGGGAGRYACAREPASLLRCAEQHHFVLLQIEPREVTVTAIQASGDELDRFTIEV